MIEAVMYGMMPRANTASLRQRAAREQVEEAEHAGAAALEELLERRGVDARHGHVSAEPVDRPACPP